MDSRMVWSRNWTGRYFRVRCEDKECGADCDVTAEKAAGMVENWVFGSEICSLAAVVDGPTDEGPADDGLAVTTSFCIGPTSFSAVVTLWVGGMWICVRHDPCVVLFRMLVAFWLTTLRQRVPVKEGLPALGKVFDEFLPNFADVLFCCVYALVHLEFR